MPPITVASDGRLDDEAPASVAMVMVDVVHQRKLAVVGVIGGKLKQRWIDQFAQYLRGRDFIWCEDNSVVLAGLARGANRTAELDAGTTAIHLAFAALRCRVWFEYVESDANWLNGPSTELLDNRWLRDKGFSAHTTSIPTWPWRLDPDTRVQSIRARLGENSDGS